jgi:hypothetical protein
MCYYSIPLEILFQPQHGINDEAKVDNILLPTREVDNVLIPAKDCNLWENGMAPLKFQLEPGMTEDFSVWKIFLMKKRIDISSLKQQSVFREHMRKFAAKDEKIADPEWGSISVVVIQKSKDRDTIL